MYWFSKWKLGREGRGMIRALHMKEERAKTVIYLGNSDFFFFHMELKVCNSFENEVKEITKSQIKKAPDGVYTAFGLYKWEGRRNSFWRRSTMKALYLWKVLAATIWRIDWRVVLEEGIPVGSFLVKSKQGISKVRTKMVAVALGMKKCTEIQETFRNYPAFPSSPISI